MKKQNRKNFQFHIFHLESNRSDLLFLAIPSETSVISGTELIRNHSLFTPSYLEAIQRLSQLLTQSLSKHLNLVFVSLRSRLSYINPGRSLGLIWWILHILCQAPQITKMKDCIAIWESNLELLKSTNTSICPFTSRYIENPPLVLIQESETVEHQAVRQTNKLTKRSQ
jgi:hypothetical protein